MRASPSQCIKWLLLLLMKSVKEPSMYLSPLHEQSCLSETSLKGLSRLAVKGSHAYLAP